LDSYLDLDLVGEVSGTNPNANPKDKVSVRLIGVGDTDDIGTRPVDLILLQDVVNLEREIILP
jgi:hypothetical protein